MMAPDMRSNLGPPPLADGRSAVDLLLAVEEVHVQHARVVASLEAEPTDAAEHLEAAEPDLLAFTGFEWAQGAPHDVNVQFSGQVATVVTETQ